MAPAPTSSLHTWLRWILFILLMGGLLSEYVNREGNRIQYPANADLSPLEKRHLALTQATQSDLNPDYSESFSKPLEKLVPHRTDGVAQPLWPWLAAWMVDLSDPRTLEYTAWFRVGLSLGGLLILGLCCMRQFSLPAAVLVVCLTAFHGLLGSVTVFTGATLFQLFFLLTWLTCLYALQRNSLWVYGLIGVFGALAYLSDDRVLPLLMVFVVISTLRAFSGWLAMHWCAQEGTSLWARDHHLFGLLTLSVCACFIAGPRLTEANRQFGDALFHYSDHVRWLDTPEAAEDWIEKHPDKASLDQVPTLERLNWKSYFQSHTSAEVKTRLIRGFHTTVTRLKGHGGELLFALLILLVVLTIAVGCGTPAACHAGEKLHPETMTTVLFLVTVTLTYALITSWDSTVLSVEHLHALTAPLGMSLLWGCESVLRRARRRAACVWLARSYQAILWILLFTMALNLWQTRTVPTQALP